MNKIDRSAWNPPEMVVPHGAFSHVVWVSGVQKWLFLTDKASVASDGSLVREDMLVAVTAVAAMP
ncbi:MAG: hypothetical protein OTJ97_09145 [SAR202 cluster bacterium]|nr:hypothetical protein [SAR202 cluster bacterium]